jgi:CubicO group peptidase (beta-lactamase class C family)
MEPTQKRNVDVLEEVAVHGTCDERFHAVRDVLVRQLATGADVGASAAVFIDGEPVVDIWGGYFDEARTRPWERDTIVNTFSTTKTMTALSALILADRGVIDFHAPVAKFWPEFAAENKGDIEVRHLLGHTAGLPGWTEPVTLADILDWEKATALLARQAPWWNDRAVSGYHPITYGPLIGEVIRRATGRTLKQFFAEEVAGPVGADYHIGAPPECDDRVSLMIASSPPRPRSGAETITDRALFNPYVYPTDSATIAWRRGELGGSNGHGNARSAAQVQQILACGGTVRNKRIVSEAGCERVFDLQAEGVDLVGGYHLRWGMGYGLGGELFNALYGSRFDGRRIAFWGGSGGSFVINDLDRRMTVAFVMNRHVESHDTDRRSIDITCAAFDSLNEVSS